MHRFGRSAQKKMNDRWGGAFILAVVLAVVAAWQIGGYLGDFLGGDKKAAVEPIPGLGNTANNGSPSSGSVASQPHEFQVHFVQVGAFRSEGAARNLVQSLSAAGYTVATAPKNAKGLVKVYTGPYLTETAASEAKAQLTANKDTAQSFVVPVTVDHNPDAVMAMTGSANSDLQRGLDSVNSYLYAAGEWFASVAAGQSADGAALAALGSELDQFSQLLAKDPNNKMAENFMLMAAAAGENAAAIQAAATTKPGSTEFQAAMNGYVSLLEQYHTFHSAQAGKQ